MRISHLFLTGMLFLPSFITNASVMPALELSGLPANQVQPVIDKQDLAAFVDGLVRAQQRTPGTAGFVVTVVDKNDVLLSRGYGLSQQNPYKAVTAGDTLFRIGSISKTFTYLAALRLIDQGKMKLDDDVNTFLPAELKIPAQGYAPIRIRHLLTHTAGFEDLALGHLFVDTPERVLSLHDYLQQHRPARVREPGKFAVYSNYSVSLLGSIIEKVSGEQFDAHIEKHFFIPMAMQHTTLREPLAEQDPRNVSAALKKLLPTGFSRGVGDYDAKGFEYIAQIGPAGGVSSSGDDMGRYMRMLLNQGMLDGVLVMPTAAMQKLDAPLFRNAEEVAAFSYGFFRRRYGAVESLEHGGATLYFHSNMVVLPSLGIGVFVSTNTDNGRPFSESLPRLIFERYFPSTRPAQLLDADKADVQNNQKYAGTYRTQRRAYRGLEAFVGMFQSEAKFSADAKGDLLMSAGEQKIRWRPIAKHLFAEVEGMNRLRFFAAKDTGEITGYTGGYGHTVSDKIGFLSSVSGFFMSMILLVMGIAVMLVSAWRRRGEPVISGWSNNASRWCTLSALLWLVFIISLLLAVILLTAQGEAALYHFPNTSLIASQWIGRIASAVSIMTALLLPALLFDIYRSFKQRGIAIVWVSIILLATWVLWNAQLTAW